MSHKSYVWILLAVGLLTHFLFFGHPDQTVFDEVHFGKFLSAYYTHEYYYDIHPPLGKLMIAGFGSFFGYHPDFAFGQIGDKFPNKTYLALRFLPSLAGSLLPLVIYLFALRLGLKPISSFFAGIFIALDNAFLTQSRLILMDGFLYLFGFLSLLFYFRYRQRAGKERVNLICFSIFAAFAASIKWTGLTFLALAGLVELYDFARSRNWNVKKLSKLVVFFAIIPFAIYFSVFAIHFSLLKKAGSGDAFMDVRFQKTLEENYNQSNESIKPMGIIGKFVDLNKQMYLGNKRLTATHPYGSKWYTWPFMSRPIYYWVSGNARIYYFGNPIVWWTSTIAMLMLLVGYITTKSDRGFLTTFLIGAYALNLLPFIGIERVMFLYHYAVALIFAILMLAYLIDKNQKPKRLLITLIALAAISFIFFSPLSYGLSLSPDQYNLRTWFDSWI